MYVCKYQAWVNYIAANYIIKLQLQLHVHVHLYVLQVITQNTIVSVNAHQHLYV